MKLRHQSMHNVAQNIILQLGGNHFRAMTSANGFLFGSDKNQNPSVQFYFQGCKKCNHLTIILDNETDTYRMKFLKIGNAKTIEVCSINGIYAKDLQRTFTEVTGVLV